jgi:hypothetical protein
MGFLSSLFGIGGGSSKPATQQVIQSTKLPPEIAPFASDVLERAQTEFERRTAEGYTPYQGVLLRHLLLKKRQHKQVFKL